MTSMTLPLDGDGFLRRECPSCEHESKWHHGPTGDEPDDAVEPPHYYCPLCGVPSGVDSWWTRPQLEHAQQAVLGVAMDDLGREFKSMERRSKGFIKVKASGDQIEPPSVLHEPDDMVIVTAPCHPWEPVKIPKLLTW